jgi:phosphate transport system substrate-binding protein
MTNDKRRITHADRLGGLSRLAGSLLIIAWLAACGPTPVITRTPVTFEFAVASAVAPLMDELTSAYRSTHQHVTFNSLHVNSARAMDALWAGEVDLAAVSWLTDTESVWLTPVAIDGVAVIVHPSNPVKNLSQLQLRDVFRGRVADWPDVGGPPGEISIGSRESGSGTRAKFEEAVMGGRSVTVNAVMAASDQAMLDYVRAVTASIGYLASGYLTGTVKAINVEGETLSVATLTNRRYPLSRPLLFVTPLEPQGELRAFVAWVLGPEGQGIVGKKYGRVK